MEVRTFKPTDYINYTDFNTIDNLIWSIYHEKLPLINVPTYDYGFIVKQLNEVMTSSSIYHTNDGIKLFGDMYFKPEGWIDLSIYDDVPNLTHYMINDWYINIGLMYDNYTQILNKNIWNIHYLLIWNEDSTIEWED